MRASIQLIAALVLVAGLVPLAAVEGAEGGDVTVRVLHDLHPDGYAVVGNLAHFGFLVADADGLPAPHHDVALTLAQDGVVLFESAALHDYDGVGSFYWTFTEPGPYAVTVTVDGKTAATFNGTAVTADAVDAALSLEAPGSVAANAPARFEYALVDAASGDVIPHTDVVVDVTRVADGQRVFRTHTHTHEEAQAFTLAFPAPGAYDVTFTAFDAFPRPDRAAVRAFTTTTRVDVHPATDVAPPADGPSTPALPGEMASAAPAEDYRLVTTFDPDPVVGPFTFQRVNAVVLDVANGTTLQHVDFTARLVDPAGRVVFESDTLHEYDGVLEVAGAFPVPGTYALHVTASARGWSEDAIAEWTVVPPAVPYDPGAFKPRLEGAAVEYSDAPWNLTVVAEDAAGRPFRHSEVDVTITRQGDAAPLVRAKLHTHGDGRFPFTFTFPHAGSYDVHVAGTTTMASASTLETATLRVTAPGPLGGVADGEAVTTTDADEPPLVNTPLPALLGVGALVTAFLAVAILGKR